MMYVYFWFYRRTCVSSVLTSCANIQPLVRPLSVLCVPFRLACLVYADVHPVIKRACIHPAYHAPASGVNGPVLRFNRHQNFVEFGDGFALLMNCGGASKEREHARWEQRCSKVAVHKKWLRLRLLPLDKTLTMIQKTGISY